MAVAVVVVRRRRGRRRRSSTAMTRHQHKTELPLADVLGPGVETAMICCSSYASRRRKSSFLRLGFRV